MNCDYHPPESNALVFPGFAGRMQGREKFLAGFRDFCENAKVHDFGEHDHQADIVGDTAVITFRYEMLYARSTQRYFDRQRFVNISQIKTANRSPCGAQC
jgi:hypothetical protein